MKDRNPWPGLASYKDDGYVFCGRRNAIAELVNIIENFRFVTLYGRTGIGKTSLLQAGVFPVLRMRNRIPIYIRLGKIDRRNEKGELIPFAQLIVERLVEEVDAVRLRQRGDRFNTKQLDARDERFLWLYFHTRRFANQSFSTQPQRQEVFPVLVLDQFEEVFEKRPKDTDLLLRQLWMLENDMLIVPSEEGYVKTISCRFVVSIREDCLYHMEDAIDRLHLPELRSNRYRLPALSPIEAKEVITIPGKELMPDDKNEYRQVVEGIIKAAQDDANSDCVSPLTLSLICSQLYEGLPEGRKFSAEMVTSQSKDALKMFYRKITSRLPITQRQKLEDLLVIKGRRTSVTLEEFKQAVPDGTYLYEQNENNILKVDNGSVEVIHDQLARMIEDQKGETRIEVYRQRIARLREITTMFIATVAIIVFIHFIPKMIWQDTIALDEKLERVYLNAEWQSRPFSIPTGVLNLTANDTVYRHAFLAHPELHELHIGNNCMIQSAAFKDCPNLRTLYLDGRDITLGLNAFIGCNQLETIIVSDSCSIREMARQAGLPSLKCIMVGENPDFMAFGNSLLVKQRRYDKISQKDTVYWKLISGSAKDTEFKYQEGEHSWRTEWHNTGHVVLPMLPEAIELDSMTADYGRLWDVRNGIPDTMHYTILTCKDKSVYTNPYRISYNQKIVSVNMPYLIHVSSSAFNSCSGIQSVILPEVGDIGEGAFSWCSKLQQMYIPQVSKIGKYAFQGCKSLYDINLPLLEIADTSVFYRCESLNKISVPKLKTIRHNAFSHCGFEDIEFPNVETIEDLVFEGCHKLRKICLPKLKSIGNNAFCSCSNLEEIVMPEESAEQMLKDIANKDYSPFSSENSFFYIYDKHDGLAVIRRSEISDEVYVEQGDTLDFNKAPIACRKLVLSKNVRAIKNRWDHIRHKEIEVAFDNPVFFSFRNTVYNDEGIVLNAQGAEHAYFRNYGTGTGYDGYNSTFTHDIKTVYLQYPQYDNVSILLYESYQSGNVSGVRIDSAGLKNIIIQVPYGFKKYYQDLPQFRAFGSVEELSQWETLKIRILWSLKYNLRSTYLNHSVKFYIFLTLAFLLMLSCLIGYIFLAMRKLSLAALTLIGQLVFTALVVVLFYTIEFNYNFSLSHIDLSLTFMYILCLVGLMAPWIMLYSLSKTTVH